MARFLFPLVLAFAACSPKAPASDDTAVDSGADDTDTADTGDDTDSEDTDAEDSGDTDTDDSGDTDPEDSGDTDSGAGDTGGDTGAGGGDTGSGGGDTGSGGGDTGSGGGGSGPDGAALYGAHCAGCHGSDGRGTDSAPDIVGEATSWSDSSLIDIMQNGKDGMPAQDLSDAEAQAVVDWMKSTF